ncbi:hypothetical protein [Sphingomonas sp.]|uniref:hypothetical protein n=1 Tax=Sphingomonas sp. TaxID=28214 RepID=UPI001DF26F8E|nr:hypothetical protein [Sphingomonas sp.]MBX9797458.1 hypothetical protein [Sphingomonas sp.]
MAENFPMFRSSLAPDYAEASVEQLDAIARTIYGPEANAEMVESFFSDLGRGLSHAARGIGQFAQRAAPIVANALPSIAQGAMSGAALGPWGALAGAIAGGAGGILSQVNNPTARAIGGGIGSVTNLLSTVRGGGPQGALGALGALGGGTMRGAGLPGAGGGSANALMGLLARPELLQAITSGAMGSFGRPSVPVGGQQVPVNMLLSALGTLANRTAHEAAEFAGGAEAVPAFIESAGEALGADTQDAEGRADTLLTLLALSPMIWNSGRPPVTVNVPPTQPAPPPIPVAPPIVTAGEQLWIAESVEDYENAGWGGESWDHAGMPEWEAEQAYG